jgi:hypothetical protein
VASAVLVPEPQNSLHTYIAEAGAPRDEVRSLDGECARFEGVFQKADLAGDNRRSGTSFGHLADHFHQVAVLGIELEKRESHAGSAGTVFHKHEVCCWIREGDPALQVRGYAAVGDLKRQRRHLRDAL